MRTALITGAAGFCGPHLARRLRTQSEIRIIGTSRRQPRPVDLSLWDEFVCATTLDLSETANLVQTHRPTWIFHLAGAFTGSEADLHESNVESTRNLLAAVRAFAPEAAVLLVGSAAEYGVVPLADLPVRESYPAAPVGAYGRAKLAATTFGMTQVNEWGADVRVARPFNIVGAGVPTTIVTGALIDRVRRVARGEAAMVPIGNIKSQRDFVAVDDVVDAYLAMMTPACSGEIVNICSGCPCSIGALIEVLRKVSGHAIPLEPDPTLMRLGEISISFGSNDKARALWGFEPRTTLAEAVASAWAFATETTTGRQ